MEPRIPQNTGNVARTCACTACRLHLVGPHGLCHRRQKLKHAGLDYWHYLDISYYDGLDDFFAKNEGPVLLLYHQSAPALHRCRLPGRAYLVLGREEPGCLKRAGRQSGSLHPDAHGHLPQPEPVQQRRRVGVCEVPRQGDFPELLDHGHLRDYEWK